ncbi:MAG: hypothetical protein K0R43_1737 [Pseudoduganella sp.]|jgi:hypothetical protein|nr:hypothetical protein [Pseudoduganella sp.]
MKDLQQAVATAFENVVASGVIEQAIEKQLTDTITTAIRDHLREYSEFGKAIKLKVQQAVGVDLERLNLPSYNELILQIIRRQTDGLLQSEAAKQLESNMEKLLQAAPPEIKLEALIEGFIEQFKEDRLGEPFSLHIERNYGSTYVCFDKEAGKSQYRCAYRLAVDKDGKVFSLDLDGQNAQKTIFMGPFWAFERTLFQLYAAKTRLIIAPDASAADFETSFPYND